MLIKKAIFPFLLFTFFSSDDHTELPVPVFAYGPHSLDFRGVYENAELFKKIIQIIKKYH